MGSIHPKARICFAVLAASIFLLMNNWQAFAQTVTGSILGTVRDPQGAVIPNATVSAKNVDTGAQRTAQADAYGGFNIVSVPAGSYQVTASAPGFQTQVRRGVVMTVGAVVRVNFKLSVGAVSQKVEVTAEAPLVDTTTSTMSGLVNDTSVRELPLNGRDWLQLAVLQPGAVRIESQSTSLGTGITHGMGMKMSISGGRPSANVYLVDGLVVNDQTNNSPGSSLGVNMGVDAIKEFSILTNTFSAEYGRSAAGVINAITKSGTNDLHGTAFYFLRNSALDARNFFDHKIPPFRRNQFGGSLGGPIKKNKLFYFANYEGLRQFLSESFSSNTLSPDARNGILHDGGGPVTIDPRIQPYLALFPLPNGTVQGDIGQYIFGAGQIGTEDFVMGKVDYLLGANTTIAGSYMFDNANSTTPDVFNEKLEADRSRNNRVILNVQHIFSPTLLNTIRTGFIRSAAAAGLDTSPKIPVMTDASLGFVPGRNVGNILVAGLDEPGGLGSTGADIFWYTAPQVSDDLSWIKGRNNMRMGFSVEAIDDNVSGLNAPAGIWQFGSIRDFFTVVPQVFNVDFPGTAAYRGARTKLFGFYFQDDLQVRPNFTLNLGLRYEPSTAISEVNGKASNLRHLTDPTVTIGNPLFGNNTMKNIAPRIGFAWDPTGTGRTAIRAGAGIYDVPAVPSTINNRIIRAAPFFESGTLHNPPSSSFPNQAFNLVGLKTLTTVYMQHNPPTSYTIHWDFNIQHQLTRNLSLMAGYVGSRGIHLPVQQNDTDQVPPSLVTTSPDGHLQFPTTGPIQRINPNFGKIQTQEWYGYSTYHSFLFSVSQRFSHGLSFQGSYTWSKSIDIGSMEYSSSELLNSMDLPYAFRVDLNRGVSDFNVPQHLSINFNWDLPSPKMTSMLPKFLLSGWELGGIFTAQSGVPFSLRIPTDQARTGNSEAGHSHAGQRPDFILGPGCSSPNAVNVGDPSNYINLQCFTYPKLGQIGNLGRNTLQGPGLEDFDFSLFKNHNLVGERLKVQFRAEFFNIFNRPNFQFQLVTPFNKQGAPLPANVRLKPPTVTSSRQIQFGMKFIW